MVKNSKRKEYKRDGRSPAPKSSISSRVMSKIGAKATKPEMAVRKHLSSNSILGYRLNCKTVQGSPDICFTKSKIAIFIHGCFWHRCPKCNFTLPKHNRQFWKKKFENNLARDLRTSKSLVQDGWKVITLWECDILNRNSWKEILVKRIKNVQKECNKGR